MPRKRSKSGMGWDEIGKTIGEKIEKECKEGSCDKSWHKWMYKGHHHHGGGLIGRAIFIIGLLMALNAAGMMRGITLFVQVLIGVGFALMSF